MKFKYRGRLVEAATKQQAVRKVLSSVVQRKGRVAVAAPDINDKLGEFFDGKALGIVERLKNNFVMFYGTKSSDGSVDLECSVLVSIGFRLQELSGDETEYGGWPGVIDTKAYIAFVERSAKKMAQEAMSAEGLPGKVVGYTKDRYNGNTDVRISFRVGPSSKEKLEFAKKLEKVQERIASDSLSPEATEIAREAFYVGMDEKEGRRPGFTKMSFIFGNLFDTGSEVKENGRSAFAYVEQIESDIYIVVHFSSENGFVPEEVIRTELDKQLSGVQGMALEEVDKSGGSVEAYILYSGSVKDFEKRVSRVMDCARNVLLSDWYDPASGWSALDTLAGFMTPYASVSANGYSAKVYICIDDPDVPTLDVVVPFTGNDREDQSLHDNLVSSLSGLGGRFNQVDLPFGGGDIEGVKTQVSVDLKGITPPELDAGVSSLFKAVEDALRNTRRIPAMPSDKLAEAVEAFMSDHERFQDFEDSLMDVVKSTAFHAVQEYLEGFEDSPEADKYREPSESSVSAAEGVLKGILARHVGDFLSRA